MKQRAVRRFRGTVPRPATPRARRPARSSAGLPSLEKRSQSPADRAQWFGRAVCAAEHDTALDGRHDGGGSIIRFWNAAIGERSCDGCAPPFERGFGLGRKSFAGRADFHSDQADRAAIAELGAFRRLLPTLGGTPGGHGHDPAAAPDRSQPRDGPHSHRTGIDGTEAERIGLANRVAQPGQALALATELAHQLAALPPHCLRNDRLSTIEHWDLDEAAAIRNEIWRGRDTIASGESLDGAGRFVAGQGRHGQVAVAAHKSGR
jgi:hypothetical protein